MEEWSERIWMTDRRAHHRFNVGTVPDFYFTIPIFPWLAVQADSLGLGGCGFKTKKDLRSILLRLPPRNEIMILLSLGNVSVEPTGKILDSIRIENDEWYTTVQFDIGSSISISGVIDTLSKLEAKDSLDVA